MESRREKAISLFKEGYNCSQSVFCAYSDIYGIDMDTALKISSSFGGGLGRMREVCGTVSAMSMVAGLETGTTKGEDKSGKQYNYEIVQKLAGEFRKLHGSIICKELLGLDKDAGYSDTKPADRTKEYYKKRPCVTLVGDAADIIYHCLWGKGREQQDEN